MGPWESCGNKIVEGSIMCRYPKYLHSQAASVSSWPNLLLDPISAITGKNADWNTLLAGAGSAPLPEIVPMRAHSGDASRLGRSRPPSWGLGLGRLRIGEQTASVFAAVLVFTALRNAAIVTTRRAGTPCLKSERKILVCRGAGMERVVAGSQTTILSKRQL